MGALPDQAMRSVIVLTVLVVLGSGTACAAEQVVCASNKFKGASIGSSQPRGCRSDRMDGGSNRLEWQRCSVGMFWSAGVCKGSLRPLSWNDAKVYANRFGPGWRLPTVHELMSFQKSCCVSPKLASANGIEAIEGDGAPYWTQTSVPKMPPLIYYVDLLDGTIDGHSPGFALGVRLVRSATSRTVEN
ncbi:DUF1566 domain-containing protein [Variovorax humicola]|uniref:Lcl C-terminal domain-containing protein n=1 Tax=Variovorax humicola TaxID=1769758 RepID=UPI003BF512B0